MFWLPSLSDANAKIMADDPYPAVPLTHPREIRLIQLAPPEDETAHFTLFKVNLDRAPPFSAISYTWDGQAPDRYVICNNQLLLITANCEAAILALRHTER